MFNSLADQFGLVFSRQYTSGLLIGQIPESAVLAYSLISGPGHGTESNLVGFYEEIMGNLEPSDRSPGSDRSTLDSMSFEGFARNHGSGNPEPRADLITQYMLVVRASFVGALVLTEPTRSIRGIEKALSGTGHPSRRQSLANGLTGLLPED